MAKYVVFDFDGTLVDSKAVFISVTNQLAEKYRFKKIGEDNIPYLQQLSLHDRLRALNLPLYKLPLLTAEFISLYKRSIHNVLLIDGMADVLQQLNESGYKTAIVSSNAVSSIETFLQNNGINNITDIYCSSKLFGKDKILRKFLHKNQLSATDIIYVGDEQRDIIACKKNDVRIIWVGWGFEIKEVVEKHQPHFIAQTPPEILQIVKANL